MLNEETKQALWRTMIKLLKKILGIKSPSEELIERWTGNTSKEDIARIIEEIKETV